MSTTTPIIDILMATYNGAAYLEEQIQSIRQQDFPDWRLLVHDDGSVDETRMIIQKYEALDQRIQWLDDQQANLGAAQNFLYLLTKSTAPYSCFADQDDIWLPNKLSRQYQAIQALSGPAAVYCNAQFLNDGKRSKRQVNELHPQQLAHQLFLNGGIIGCSILFNQALRQSLLPLPHVVAMHDYLVVTAALSWGQLRYQNEVLLYYRQHPHNVTGSQKRGFRSLAGKLFQGRTVVDQRHYRANQHFYKTYSPNLSLANQALFAVYFEIVQEKNRLKQLILIHRYRFQLGHQKYLLYLKVLFRHMIHKR